MLFPFIYKTTAPHKPQNQINYFVAMKPSALLRTLSSKLSSHFSPSSAVVPWPPAPIAFDRWLTAELDELRGSHYSLYPASSFLSKCLKLSISAQRETIDSIESSSSSQKSTFNAYLDDTVDLLDMCNSVRRRIDDVKTYNNSLSIALHSLAQREPSEVAAQRALSALDSCAATERRCAELGTCRSSLRVNVDQDTSQSKLELQEALSGSRALAMLVVSMANVALSFRSRRGVTMIQSSSSSKSGSCWRSSMVEMQKGVKEEYDKRRKDGVVLEELKSTVSTVKRLRGVLRGGGRGGEVRCLVGELRRSSEELERRVRVLEEGVDGLYRGLVDVRMCLLRVISEA